MKYILSLLFPLFCITIDAQTNITLDKYFSVSDINQASIGITIKDLSGNIVAAHNGKESLVPASTMKIVTTATALELYGGKYQIPTIVGIDKRDPQHIVIQGYGDPTLGSEYVSTGTPLFLDLWTNIITKKVDKSKPITISVVDDYFGYDGISFKWPYEDLGNYYAAGAYGISVFDNTYKLYLNSLKLGQNPAIEKTVPAMNQIVFKNNLELNNIGRDNAFINGLPFSNDRTLNGTIPSKRQSFVIKGDIPDPGLRLGEALGEKLKSSGYKVSVIKTMRNEYQEHINSQDLYKHIDITPIYTNNSPSLTDIIRIVNVRSNNHYAEHLIRLVGRFQNRSLFTNALDRGTDRVKTFWQTKGINTNSIIMYDGSGLSPSDGISTDNLTDILIYMQTKSANSTDFLASFPKAGIEGTVRNLLKGTRLEGKVSVKSGSIANVQCFAGYYISENKKYVFSVIVNNYNSPRKNIVKAIESILLDYLK